MQVWLGEHEVEAAQFAVQARGFAPQAVGAGRRLRRLLQEAAAGLLTRSELTSRSGPDGERSATVVAREAALVLRATPAGLLLTAHAFAAPAAAVEAVEAALLRLQPEEVALVGLPRGGASPWTPYMAEGALLVRMIHQHTSPYQTIEVGEHPVYGRMLFLNGETQIAASDERLYSASLVEPALRGGARRVCILGGGDCGVLRQVLSHPVERVVMAEIDSAVIETAAQYFPEVVGDAREDPRAEIVLGDAFEYLAAQAGGAEAGQGFDLIVYDLSDAPLNDATFDRLCGLVNAALAPGGRVAVQCGSALPLYADRLQATLAGLQRNFEQITTEEVVVPSFLRQPWVFAFARRKG